MKKNTPAKFSGFIASAMLIVSICSVPMMAEAQTVRNQSTRKTVAQAEIPSPGAAVSARASVRSAYSQARTGTVTVSLPTGNTVAIRVSAASRGMSEAQSVRNQSAQKPVTQTEIPSPDTAARTRTSARSTYSQARTGEVTVSLPTGGKVTISVPTVSREKAPTSSQFNTTSGKTAVRKTGAPSSLTVTNEEKAAAIFNASPVAANTSAGKGTSGAAVKAEGQPTKSNSSSLCLVVLGLQLKPDGSMQQELIGRLEALKVAAQNNPQAIIVCTGGHSAENNRAVSEAGQMAKWLRENGIDPNRILVESNGMSTQGNASYTLKLLNRYHPEVSRITIFTSDYHMDEGVRLFTAQAAQTGSGITVSAGRAW